MALSVSGAVSLLTRAPTALFPIALGLAGLGAGLKVGGSVTEAAWLKGAGAVVLITSATVLAVDILLYAAKLIRARAAVADDFAVANKANLLAPGFMAAMIIGGQLSATSPLGGPIWLIATVGHLLLLLLFVGGWLTKEYQTSDLNPTWFLPAAGIMTAALSWPGLGPVWLPVFALAGGATLWILLVPLVFRRLVFEPALDPKLRPSLFILAAPFGLSAGGLLTVVPDIPIALPVGLLLGGLFFILVLLTQPRFLTEAGISLSWWGTTFPITAIAAGFLRLSEFDMPGAEPVGLALLGLGAATTFLALLGSIRALGRTCFKTVSSTEEDIAAMQGIELASDETRR